MLAASYWSLLAPAIEMAEHSGSFGAFAFIPVAVGFALGAAFVFFADLLIPVLVSALPRLCLLHTMGLTQRCSHSWCQCALGLLFGVETCS